MWKRKETTRWSLPVHRAPSLALQHIHGIPEQSNKITCLHYPKSQLVAIRERNPHQSSCFLLLSHATLSHRYQPHPHSWFPALEDKPDKISTIPLSITYNHSLCFHKQKIDQNQGQPWKILTLSTCRKIDDLHLRNPVSLIKYESTLTAGFLLQ